MIAVYVFGGILAVLLGAVIVAALVEREAPPETGPESARARLEAALEALRWLEFEYHTGKLTEEDYVRLREGYAREAVAARDALRREEAADGGERAATPGADSARCPACGAPAAPGARFCGDCGAGLRGEAAGGG